GLVWAGRATYKDDLNRSIDPAFLQPLTSMSGVRFFSLQKDRKGSDLFLTPMIDWTDELRDFADTAALIDNLDLVISVDTAVAYLAGAMGKPAWVLLPFVPDWRWMLDRSDSPWYPTMRLFRQPQLRDWQTPFNQVVAELQSLADYHKMARPK